MREKRGSTGGKVSLQAVKKKDFFRGGQTLESRSVWRETGESIPGKKGNDEATPILRALQDRKKNAPWKVRCSVISQD